MPTKFQTIALAASTVALAALGVASVRRGDIVIFNHSPSLPIGLYLRAQRPFDRGAIVTVRAIAVARTYAEQRHFAGPSDRFIKYVAAVKGDVVCAAQDIVQINGRTVAHRAAFDSAGRKLPSWSGCHVLEADELFLLGASADSFDGRYFGVVKRLQIEGAWMRLTVL